MRVNDVIGLKDWNNTNVYIIKSGTGTSKTETAKRLIKEIEQDQNKKFRNIFYAVPTNKLKRDIANNRFGKEIKFKMTPDFDELKDRELKRKLNFYQERGLYKQLKKYIKNLLSTGFVLDVNDSIILNEYVCCQKELKDYRGVILTTHKRFIYMPPQAYIDSIVIIDEDFIETLYEVVDFTVGDVGYASANIPSLKDLIDFRISEIVGKPYKEINKLTPLNYYYDTVDIAENEILENDVNINIFDFLDSSYVYMYNPVDNANEEVSDTTIIRCMLVRPLPFMHTIIMSATINQHMWKDILSEQSRKVYFAEVPKVKYAGNLRLMGKHSYSREYFKQNEGLFRQIVDKHKDITNMNIISFEKMLIEEGISGENIHHFFSMLGVDTLNGKPLTIIGKPEKNDLYYKFLAYAIYGVNFENTERVYMEVETDEYIFWLYTYEQEELRNIHMWVIQTELEQCIGRARLVMPENKDTIVNVYCGFPPSQAEIVIDDELDNIPSKWKPKKKDI
ncbi:MAG: hypothetical protein FWF46_05490 [Oscillospiraceae bacterium]|nr:hypothetical protein [Oscillospiraceae bacterium]